MLTSLRDSLLNLFFPQACHLCSRTVESHDDGVACRQCWAAAAIFTGRESKCEKCGQILSEEGFRPNIRCGRCSDHFYDSAHAAAAYDGAVAASVIDLKTVPHVSRRVRTILNEAFDRCELANTTLLVPVPLSGRRYFERGFNQAGLLAAALGRSRGIVVDDFSLVRTRHTPKHRAAMDRKARSLTVRNAFAVKRPRLIVDHQILLIDDIFTSGATASNCAKALKASGAAGVRVLTLARAV